MIASSFVGLVRIDHGRLERGHFGGQRADGTDAVHHRGDRALARHLADILAEIADGHAGIDHDQAVVGLLLAGDHAEQRRLAGAVGADKPDLLALLDAHRRFDEQDLVAVLLGDIVEADHERSANAGAKQNATLQSRTNPNVRNGSEAGLGSPSVCRRAPRPQSGQRSCTSPLRFSMCVARLISISSRSRRPSLS
jgi:hypothetical protein